MMNFVVLGLEKYKSAIQINYRLVLTVASAKPNLWRIHSKRTNWMKITSSILFRRSQNFIYSCVEDARDLWCSCADFISHEVVKKQNDFIIMCEKSDLEFNFHMNMNNMNLYLRHFFLYGRSRENLAIQNKKQIVHIITPTKVWFAIFRV